MTVSLPRALSAIASSPNRQRPRRPAAAAETAGRLRERIEALLRRLDALPAERATEVVEALEYAATPEARALLEQLAGGLAEARLTREAKASVERLGKR